MIRIYLWKAAFYQWLSYILEKCWNLADGAHIDNAHTARITARAKVGERLNTLLKERDYAEGMSSHWFGISVQRHEEAADLLEDFEEEVAKLLK